jgi:parallel beta-helix repeat protein
MINCHSLLAYGATQILKQCRMSSITLSLILLYLSGSICFASTFYIDPSAATNGTGTQASPYNTWRLTLQPGNTYLQKAGTNYNAQLWIGNVNGTAALPVVIDKYGSGANPIANNAYLGGDSFITVRNFSFPNGVNIEKQSTNSQITLANNDISNPGGSGVGLYIGAGTNIVASGNTIHDTLTDCVALDTTGNTSGNGIQFLNNTVFNCGIHGLTVWTSFATVSGNIVHTTGLHGGGSSAIHMYNGCWGADPCGTEGHDNLITHNVVYDAHDTQGDGNGIQIDQMTQNNTITQNLSFFNDGQGISLYDSANNVVGQNVFFNNGMDRNFSHSLRGNITVDASTRFYGTHGNSIVNNTAIVSDVGASAGERGTGPFGFEVSQPAGNNSYGGNKLLKANSDPSMNYYNWWNTPPIPPTQGNDIAFWNGTSNPNRVHAAPDQFGSVTISNAAGAPPMDFILPMAYQIPVLYNGAALTLYGWRADNGLYGTYPNSPPPNSLPDVIVSSLSYSSATGLFTSVVTNQGTAATPAGVTVGVSYSVDGAYRTWGSVMGPLAAGASVTIGCGGGAYPIPSGTHTITAFADDINRFAESNKTNNTLSQTITIP